MPAGRAVARSSRALARAWSITPTKHSAGGRSRPPGWRLRKRDGDAEPLLKALGQRDPDTQFLAAEALAKAGRPGRAERPAGEHRLRHRPCPEASRRCSPWASWPTNGRSIPCSGSRARRATPSRTRPPRPSATWGRSDRAEDAFKLLERLAQRIPGVARSALKGLRWLNTRAGWQLVRRKAADKVHYRDTAVELLGYHDDPATRDLLLRLLGTISWDDDDETMDAARRLWGPESLEARLRRHSRTRKPLEALDSEEIVGRIRAGPGRAGPDLRHPGEMPATKLCDGRASILLSRASLPVAEAAVHSTAATHARRRPGRPGPGTRRRRFGRRGEADGGRGPPDGATPGRSNGRKQMGREEDEDLRLRRRNSTTPCLRDLGLGRRAIGRGPCDDLAAIVRARPDDPAYRPIRRETVLALASGKRHPRRSRR